MATKKLSKIPPPVAMQPYLYHQMPDALRAALDDAALHLKYYRQKGREVYRVKAIFDSLVVREFAEIVRWHKVLGYSKSGAALNGIIFELGDGSCSCHPGRPFWIFCDFETPTQRGKRLVLSGVASV